MESVKNTKSPSHSNFEGTLSITYYHGGVTLNKYRKKNDDEGNVMKEATQVEEVKSATKGKKKLGNSKEVTKKK